MERRQTLRRRTLLGGRIEFLGRATFDCVIRNLSDTGAKISCAQHIVLPDLFHLVILKRDERRRVRTIWRGEEVVGLEFVADADYENVIAFIPPSNTLH